MAILVKGEITITKGFKTFRIGCTGWKIKRAWNIICFLQAHKKMKNKTKYSMQFPNMEVPSF